MNCCLVCIILLVNEFIGDKVENIKHYLLWELLANFHTNIDNGIELTKGGSIPCYWGIEMQQLWRKSFMNVQRILAVSDVHVDHNLNLKTVQSWSDYNGTDALILAGDVTDNLDLFKSTLQILSAAFRAVFLVPGNHDLWVRSKVSHGRYSPVD